MLRWTSSGSTRGTEGFIRKILKGDIYSDLDRFGQMGVDALRRATPIDSGITADAWSYRIIKRRSSTGIAWYNTNTNKGVNIAIILQYGHGTGTGGYVYGRDYINPAVQPLFDRIADNVWEKVIRG